MTFSELKKNKEELLRFVVLFGLELFCIFSFFYFAIAERNNGKAVMSFLSVLYLLVPNLAQRLFKFRISTTLYIFILIYAVCPLLGYSYKLYYLLDWWDDLLHCFAGVIFAMLGAYLPKVLNKDGENSVALCAFCAVCFSMAISVLWEFAEFGMDRIYGTDMQKDTMIYSLRSYLLGEELGLSAGEMGIIEIIDQTNIDGVLVQGYIDIGLIDTMKDMFVETLGAVLYMVLFIGGKGKRFVFEPVPEAALPESKAETPSTPDEIAATICDDQTDEATNAPVTPLENEAIDESEACAALPQTTSPDEEA